MKGIFLSFVFCILYIQGFCGEIKTEDLIHKVKPEYFDITEKNVSFILYTRRNKNTGVVLVNGDKVKLQASGFKGSLPTKICTHGFMNDGEAGWLKNLKEELLKAGDMNVIIYDWSTCSKNILYPQVVKCVKKAGLFVGEMLKFLQKEAKLDLNKAHLIGHSLGAHLMSFASDALPTKKVIGRVTGLDPAGPLFENVAENERMNPNCGKFVDVIHTCRIFTGMKKPVGTADFYPNGGYDQPGCKKVDQACHHRTSYKFFIDSVNKSKISKYTGAKCKTLDHAINKTCKGTPAVMGYHADQSKTGLYYLKVT